MSFSTAGNPAERLGLRGVEFFLGSHVDDLAGKRVLVTGATGFIGSHLVERLLDEGCSVRALGHYRSDRHPGNLALLDPADLQKVDLVWGDVCDRDLAVSATRGIDIVFHLAALIGIPYSYQAPASYVQTNVVGTLNMLQAARESGVERFVHTSTSEVYGSAQYTPIDEAHPLVAQSPYAATKIGADQLAESFHRSFGLAVATIRPFNTYGPRQSDRAIIPTILAQCLSDSARVEIGDSTPVRDFVFVTDTVDGFVKASVREEAVGTVVNLATGKGISIGELAETACNQIGGGPIETVATRGRPDRSEVRQLIGDPRRAGALLGWFPTVALSDGLTRTAEFIRAHSNRFAAGKYAV